jgi:hypothetical protein
LLAIDKIFSRSSGGSELNPAQKCGGHSSASTSSMLRLQIIDTHEMVFMFTVRVLDAL